MTTTELTARRRRRRSSASMRCSRSLPSACLHVSMSRLVSSGPPQSEVAALVQAAGGDWAEVCEALG
jgi:hypothetical protein